MMRLNRKVEYSLIVLKYMSQKKPGQLSTAKEMSEKFNAPFDATSRVLQIMSQNGILKSEQGAQGGYQIIKELQRVSFHQLNEMILGPIAIAKCISKEGEGDCELQSSCNILSPIRLLNQKFLEFLKDLSVAEAIGLSETTQYNHQESSNSCQLKML